MERSARLTDSLPVRVRRVAIVPFPRERQIVVGGLRAGRRQAPIHGIVQIDVTVAKQLIAALDPRPSLTAFVVSAVARAAADHPEVHAYRNWRGRLVLHSHVDVATMVEIPTPRGPVPIAHLIRDADTRSVVDISDDIRGVQRDSQVSRSGRLVRSMVPWATRIPGGIRLFYLIVGRSVRARRLSGTVAVTSIGMFGQGGGIGIGQPTTMTLTVVVGGISARPVVHEGEVAIREILDLTVTVDHNVVDGAPAARFVADLKDALEMTKPAS